MFRRAFLKMVGAGAAGGGLFSVGQSAIAATDESVASESEDFSVGDLNLNDVDVIDTHVHPMRRETLSSSYLRHAGNYAELSLPAYDYPGKADQLAELRNDYKEQIFGLPRVPGYVNFVARTYRVPPEIESIDEIVTQHLNSDADYGAYTASILDRDKIAAIVLQSREEDPVAPPSYIPKDRFVWTWPFTAMLQPEWARRNNATTLRDVVDLIDDRLETAVANGCRGFKNGSAYYRPYTLQTVTESEAESALRLLLTESPEETNRRRGEPLYKSDALNAALRTYEDYLFKHVYVKVGELEQLVIIHTAVAMAPPLRADYNNPMPLYDVFKDGDIQKAGTRFVLIHTGFPSHHIVASMISQFPNVYTDMSWFAQCPGALEETYRAFLSIGPSTKIMHGSDINTVPEGLGYVAWNSRSVLARILRDYKKYYGWRQSDVTEAAHNILHANARRLFRIPG